MFKRSVIKNVFRGKMDVCLRFDMLMDSIYATVFLVVLILLIILIPLIMFVRLSTSPLMTRTQLYIPDVCRDKKCPDQDETLSTYLYQAVKKQYQQTVEEKERKMREYFESGIKIRLGIDRTNEHLEDMKPAGKLIGKRQKRQNRSIDGNKSKKMIPIRLWLKGRECYNSTCFFQFGIKEYNGRLVVSFTGIYSMYSYVEYTENTNSTLFKHEICRYSALRDHLTVISSDVKRYTDKRRDSTGIFGSYIFAVAHLRAGDELSVRVNDMMSFEPSSNNFFGLNII